MPLFLYSAFSGRKYSLLIFTLSNADSPFSEKNSLFSSRECKLTILPLGDIFIRKEFVEKSNSFENAFKTIKGRMKIDVDIFFIRDRFI